jgi:hypothetical protein
LKAKILKDKKKNKKSKQRGDNLIERAPKENKNKVKIETN